MGAFPLLTAAQLDLSQDVFDFQQTISDTLGQLGTTGDGFDQDMLDLGALLTVAGDPGDAIDGDLGLATTIASSIDPNSLAGDAASLPASLAEGDSILSDAHALSGAVQPAPAPPTGSGGGTGGSSAPSSDCGKRTNQYGLSKPGAFPGTVCDAHLTFQVLRAQDGPCTYSAAPAPAAGSLSLPQIVSFTLVQGDPTIWSLGHKTLQASDGTPYDVYTVTIHPRVTGQAASFWGVGRLVTSSPSQSLNLCLSVDAIP